MPDSPLDTEATLRNALVAWPELADRIARQLLIVLHSEGLVSIDAVYDEARAAAGQSAPTMIAGRCNSAIICVETSRCPEVVPSPSWNNA